MRSVSIVGVGITPCGALPEGIAALAVRACRAALGRFEQRFRFMEERLAGPLGERSLEELMAAWSEAKRAFS